MQPEIKVAFASGTDELNLRLIEHMRGIFPQLPLYVVSEFPPEGENLTWVRYRGNLRENLARCRHVFRGKSIRLAGVMLVPDVPFRRMRLLALILAPLYFLAVNENLGDFMLRPGSLPAIARHIAWRIGNFLRWQRTNIGWMDFPYLAARVGAVCRHGGDSSQLSAWRSSLAELRMAAPQDAQSRRSLLTAVGAAWRGESAPGDAASAYVPTVVAAGRTPSGKPRVIVVSAYLPFPLAHGGAVRIHNLTECAAAEWDQVLICFVETNAVPPPELLERFVEVILVHRLGSHAARSTRRPEVVEQFASEEFRTALRTAVQRWHPAVVQLEFTQMAQYARDCTPARTILVEHDITFDLYGQLARDDNDWDLHTELAKWRRFESAAWREVDCVVTMSEKDAALVHGARAVVLPNGVDLQRFQVAQEPAEPTRVLFVGSFSHLPNMIAAAFFLEEAWPAIRKEWPGAKFHMIAGANHEYFVEYQSHKVPLNCAQPGVELEGFVSDVRPAYKRASVVIAPLVASAGTNLKVLEAMSCGRPVISTPAGVNGLDLVPGVDFILVNSGAEMAAAVSELFASPEKCASLAAAGRARVERSYGWDAIARRQNELYLELSGIKPAGPGLDPN